MWKKHGSLMGLEMVLAVACKGRLVKIRIFSLGLGDNCREARAYF